VLSVGSVEGFGLRVEGGGWRVEGGGLRVEGSHLQRREGAAHGQGLDVAQLRDLWGRSSIVIPPEP